MTDIVVKDIKNGSEYYYGGSAEVSAEDVSYDNTTSGATATNVQDAIDEVFQSVSNGKTLIAAAITDKGVSTAASDSFATMAENIESLNTEPAIITNIKTENPGLVSGVAIAKTIKNFNSTNYDFTYLGNSKLFNTTDSNIYIVGKILTQVSGGTTKRIYFNVVAIGEDGSLQTLSNKECYTNNSAGTLNVGKIEGTDNIIYGFYYYPNDSTYNAVFQYNTDTKVLSNASISTSNIINYTSPESPFDVTISDYNVKQGESSFAYTYCMVHLVN